VDTVLVDIAPVDGLDPESSVGSVFIETYGCQMNVSDSELMRRVLNDAGFSTATSPEEADVVLLNTCAIREHAEDRVIGRLGQLRHLKIRNPDLVLGVCGCMAKHMSEKLMDRLPYVDLVMGPDSYRDLADLVIQSKNEPSLSVRLDRTEHYDGVDPVRSDGVTAWITVQRGCDKFCTFCVVPYVRGRERSVRADEIVRQVEVAAEEGYRDVTLLGQTVNSYTDGACDFSELLRRVARVPGIDRVRFTSPHPSDFSERLITTVAEVDELCKFIHLPVQSGSTRVLERMQRTYTRESYLDLVDRLRDAIPNLALSTDVIVGFPGETADDFGETLDLVRHVRFDFAFMFKYSDREGTIAHREIPDTVSEAEKGIRLTSLIDLQSRISAEVNGSYVGRVLNVLVEGRARKGEGRVFGKSDGFKTVVFTSETEPNTFVPVRITSATQKTLMGEAVVAR
jgi:tRNA-2-methylthio-N6-dimethylallyladenosine synthase